VTSADFAEFDLPGPLVIERGDVARIIGDRDVKPDNVRPGLVPCVTCGSLQAPRADGGQLGVHFATLADQRPCAGSWPAKVRR
jgi:hypothetical protein